MPLRDHFHSSANLTRHWSELHGQWPGEIVRQLLPILPAGFQAGPQVHLGAPFEVDIGAFDLDSRDPDADTGGGSSGTATMTVLAPTLTVEAEVTDQDEYEIRIYDVEFGRQLVATIELVSPSNKDRPASRELFVGKVAALLQQGVSVSLVDLVTVRQANLYGELLGVLGHADPALGDSPPHLYAVTLRTRQVHKKKKRRRQLLDAWYYPMAVGQPLPTIPLWLTEELRVMLPLEAGYEETCRILGIA
jgi:hypothetical protein